MHFLTTFHKVAAYITLLSEDEIHAVRQSFQESLNNERQKIVAEYEGENGKLATKLNEQREELNNEVYL